VGPRVPDAQCAESRLCRYRFRHGLKYRSDEPARTRTAIIGIAGPQLTRRIIPIAPKIDSPDTAQLVEKARYSKPSKSQSLGRLVVRRETGKEQEVQVLYDEDLASHIAPKPCVVSREGQGEASVGDRAGWPLSRERALSRAPTGLPTWKATRLVSSPRAAGRPGVVRDPSMRGHSLPGNREISSLAGAVARLRSAPGRGQTRSRR
jgi:hypothetical protein